VKFSEYGDQLRRLVYSPYPRHPFYTNSTR